MLKGFKEFLLRGNVIDLAVAVVIGAAFGAIVTAFTGSIIKPLINSFGGADAAQGLGFTIRDNNPSTFVDFGTLITAALNFVIIAAVVYFIIVLPFEKLKALRAKAGDDAAALTEAELLTEIRDLLAGKDPKASKPVDESMTTAFSAGSGGDKGPSPLDRAPNIPPQSQYGQQPAPTQQYPPVNQPPQGQPYPQQQYGQQPPPPQGGGYGPQYGQPGGQPGEYRPADYPPPPGYRPDGPGRHGG